MPISTETICVFISLLGIVNTATVGVIMYLWKSKVSKDECSARQSKIDGVHLDLREIRQWVWEILAASNGNKGNPPPLPPPPSSMRGYDERTR